MARLAVLLVLVFGLVSCERRAQGTSMDSREPVVLEVSTAPDARIYADHQYVSFTSLDSMLGTLKVATDSVVLYREIGVTRPGSRGDSLFRRVRTLVQQHGLPFDVSDTARGVQLRSGP